MTDDDRASKSDKVNFMAVIEGREERCVLCWFVKRGER